MEFGNDNVRVRMEDDRISSLPDDIIHHILSFNDAKYAVQTSVLSPRWRFIWTTLPYLKFSTDEFCNRSDFSKFVNRVLSRRDNQTEVSRLDLYVNGPASSKFVHDIRKVIVPRYGELFLKRKLGLNEEYQQLPLCFFGSQSLKHLSIKTDRVHNIFPLSQSPWDFPALTAIELNNIRLRAENTMCLDLFSKCVRLKNLTLSNCHFRGFKVVKIICPRLVCLTISRCHPSEYEILAPNLSSFSYEGFRPPFLSTGGGLCSLEKVKLHTVTIYSPNKEAAHEFMNMLYELRNSRFLTLGGSVIELLSKVLDLLERQPSPFCNLKWLKIGDVVTQQELTKSELSSKVANYLLSNSPTATVSMELRKTCQSSPPISRFLHELRTLLPQIHHRRYGEVGADSRAVAGDIRIET